MIYIIITLILMSILYKYLVKPYSLYRKYKKYGDGYFFPLFGEAAEYYQNLQKHQDCEYSFKHYFDKRKPEDNRIIVSNMGTSVKINLVDPDLIKQFYQKSENYHMDHFFMSNLYRLFGTEEEDQKLHRNFRKQFAPAFNFEYLQNLSSQITKITDNKINSLIQANNFKDIDPIAFSSEITGQVILLSFLGDTLENLSFRNMKLPHALSYILNCLCGQMGEIGYILFGAKYTQKGYFKQHKEVEDFMQEFKNYLRVILKQKIEIYRKEFEQTGNIKQTCILSLFIQNGEIDKIDLDDLLKYFLNFFLAGTETTSNLVGMTIYYLTQNKEVQQKLQQEIDQNTDYSAEALSNLPYLNATIKETLRYQGPGNSLLDRIAVKEHYLEDIKIEKGVIVNVYMKAVHRDSRFYSDPHTYNPQRWLDSKENKSLHPFTYLPFSAGQRNCIGQHLALIEARIILNSMIKNFNFKINEGYKLILDFKFSPQPLNPLQIHFDRR
ncbi:cytochrome P450 family monooxygenase (macronuclear) [Tetrahymena thermophila SB210]|uniref:Cytochrome P450 family monooxygenase n=2 Tax=Tetrahymena thermophila TaxID=5911 RepID=Q22KD1_TETTS|nr:cytochrome P450 family monooxygenase [Tetrahymena thermophila SB210]ABY59991.1 cytochrome P450 monooxygenase CYP5013E1 [Tetrahymena thermophila]EAR85868.3 cytochrome P450 family monooxygenase [Tetrahymena thermophila SB210]|eukprot:XP_001033531.3 cytochrome P450 family monooxygenase [Tetrahymena thermophila SB210]